VQSGNRLTVSPIVWQKGATIKLEALVTLPTTEGETTDIIIKTYNGDKVVDETTTGGSVTVLP
jgi:hypothetical protein